MKTLLKFVLCIGFPLLSIIIVLPMLLSYTSVGKSLITSSLEQYYSFQHCTYETLSLSWFSFPVITGFRATKSDSPNTEFISQKIIIKKTLFSLIFNSSEKAKVEVQSPALGHTLLNAFTLVFPCPNHLLPKRCVSQASENDTQDSK